MGHIWGASILKSLDFGSKFFVLFSLMTHIMYGITSPLLCSRTKSFW